MNSRGKYLIKNTAIFALSNIGTKIINFFLVPLYTYVLTNEQYGTTDLIFTISSFLAPILILNINEAIMRFALDNNADDNKLLSIGLVTIGASAVIGLLLIPLVDCIHHWLSISTMYIFIPYHMVQRIFFFATYEEKNNYWNFQLAILLGLQLLHCSILLSL